MMINNDGDDRVAKFGQFDEDMNDDWMLVTLI
jgi:hypothetical protein